VVICLQRGADLHMAQLMPLPLTVSRFSKIQFGFTFLVPAHLGGPGCPSQIAQYHKESFHVTTFTVQYIILVSWLQDAEKHHA